jgi:hypothetical protein
LIYIRSLKFKNKNVDQKTKFKNKKLAGKNAKFDVVLEGSVV